MSQKFKVLIIVVVVSVLSATSVSILEHQHSKKTTAEYAENQLKVVRWEKKLQVQKYFQNLSTTVELLSQDDDIQHAIKEFKTAFEALPSNGLEKQKYAALKNHYENFIARLALTTQTVPALSNYFPTSNRGQYLQYQFFVNGGTEFSHFESDAQETGFGPYIKAHKNLQPQMENILTKCGFYDAFLIDETNGDILYSSGKEVDLGTNLVSGPYQNTNLAALFQSLKNTGKNANAIYTDFEWYPPSGGDPASFIGIPVQEDGKTIGILAFQMSINYLNELLTSKQAWKQIGLGETGEAYIVGPDNTMRTMSRFLIEDQKKFCNQLRATNHDQREIERIVLTETTILGLQVQTTASQNALNGQTGFETIQDYRDVKVLSAYTPLEIPGLDWALMVEKDQAETSLKWNDSLSSISLVLLGVVVGSFLLSYLLLGFVLKKTAQIPA